MNGFRLYFDNVKYFDSERKITYSAFELDAFREDLGEININTAIAELKVEEKRFPSGEYYEWNPSEIKFYTKEKIQILYIILITSSTHDNKPQFHLHGAEAEIPAYLTKIQHKPSGTFLDLPTHSEFPADTDIIKVWFAMPGDKPASFKFNAIAWDNEKKHEVPCDPQVGNEPP